MATLKGSSSWYWYHYYYYRKSTVPPISKSHFSKSLKVGSAKITHWHMTECLRKGFYLQCKATSTIFEINKIIRCDAKMLLIIRAALLRHQMFPMNHISSVRRFNQTANNFHSTESFTESCSNKERVFVKEGI